MADSVKNRCFLNLAHCLSWAFSQGNLINLGVEEHL